MGTRQDEVVNSTATAATVTGVVERMTPFDVLEADHHRKTLFWGPTRVRITSTR